MTPPLSFHKYLGLCKTQHAIWYSIFLDYTPAQKRIVEIQQGIAWNLLPWMSCQIEENKLTYPGRRKLHAIQHPVLDIEDHPPPMISPPYISGWCIRLSQDLSSRTEGQQHPFPTDPCKSSDRSFHGVAVEINSQISCTRIQLARRNDWDIVGSRTVALRAKGGRALNAENAGRHQLDLWSPMNLSLPNAWLSTRTWRGWKLQLWIYLGM